ncbi:MAG: hypothetical protein L6Q54_11705 [Leptospiraceae bacterium]|nr:hypothetical protein [Leptospiraceae bacterium]
MSIVEGNILQDWSYDPLAASLITDNITGELQQCELMPRTGLSGFWLIECPLYESPSTVTVKRETIKNATVTSGLDTITGINTTADIIVGMTITGTGIPAATTVLAILSPTSVQMSANASGTYTSDKTFTFNFSEVSGSPSTYEYFVDYNNDTARIILNSSQNGFYFRCSYKGKGASLNVRNQRKIFNTVRSYLSIIRNVRQTSVYQTISATKSLYGKMASVNNLTIDNCQLIVDQGLQGVGVLHVYGDLTLIGSGSLVLRRTLLIVYGNIYSDLGGLIHPGHVGAPGGDSGVSGSNAEISLGGAGGSAPGILGGGGGGGGAGDAGSGGQIPTFNGVNGGIGAGGGGADHDIITGGIGGAGGVGDYWVGAGGAGGASTGGYIGNNGGGGGGGGGLGILIIAFGDISQNLEIYPGNGGFGGAPGGYGGFGVGGTSGDVHLWSKYTSAPCNIHTVVNTTYGNARDGYPGNIYINPIDSSDFPGILSDITKNPLYSYESQYQLGWIYNTKKGTAF